MFDARKLLDQLVGSGAAGGFAGGLAGGALGSMLAGKKGKKLAGNALKVGGLALVGGLAYKAWQHHQQGKSAANAPVDAPDERAFLPDNQDVAGTQALNLLLARAMIAAAKADGQIDNAILIADGLDVCIVQVCLAAQDAFRFIDETRRIFVTRFEQQLLVDHLVFGDDVPAVRQPVKPVVFGRDG